MKPAAGLLLLLACAAPSGPRPWLGMTMTLEQDPVGIRVRHVMTGAPAAEAGLKHNDLIVGAEGISFDVPRDKLLTHFTDAIARRKPGEVIRLEIQRDRVEQRAMVDGRPADDPPADWDEYLRARPPGPELKLEAQRRRERLIVPVTLKNRPRLFDPRDPMPPSVKRAPAELEASVDPALVRDLRFRLSKLHEAPDPFRLSIVAEAHRYPFHVGQISKELTTEKFGISEAANLLGCAVPRQAQAPSWRTAEACASYIETVLVLAFEHRALAFRRLTSEEQKFMFDQIPKLGEAMIEATYLQSDTNARRLEGNLRLIQLASLVDYTELFKMAAQIEVLVSGKLFAGLHELQPKEDGVFLTRDTPFGKIVFSGRGRTWHKEDAAVIVDLGGDDLYTNNAGGTRPGMPFGIVIDIGGNDAYESSVDWCQGAGRMGVGLLVDTQGDDVYLGQRWAQGVAAFGAGFLFDLGGTDRYKADEFAQGAAVFGMARVMEWFGNDRYQATRFAQGFAASMAVAWVRDLNGDDEYYCKGRQETSFGDKGIFEGWGQGCATGFRGVASGGIGILADQEGNDRYEGGNYTQGGGFYFGWGVCFDGGGHDTYIASRWGQAFAAHQAVGTLEDASGNDRYILRQGGGQSFAWEESVTALIDRRGDDYYRGGRFHCLAASAHNGFALFVEELGVDCYDYAPGPGLAGPNDYHGGESFSLFIDREGQDAYPEPLRNQITRKTSGTGMFIDR